MARYTIAFDDAFEKLLADLAAEASLSPIDSLRRAVSRWAYLVGPLKTGGISSTLLHTEDATARSHTKANLT